MEMFVCPIHLEMCVSQSHMEEDRQKIRLLNRSSFRVGILFLTRIVVNLVVLGLLIGVLALIVYVTDETSQVSCIRIVFIAKAATTDYQSEHCMLQSSCFPFR